MAHTENPSGVVIGLDDGTTGIQTARILAARRIPVVALARNRRHFCCRTNVCRRIIEADLDSDALIDTLLRLGPGFDEKPVLFPCQDRNVLLVARHRDALADWFHVVLPPTDVVEMMMDKTRFYRFAADTGLPIPQTRFLHDLADVTRAATELRFPCILKPPLRTPRWTAQTHAKAFRIDDRGQLLQRFEQCRGWADSLIVQEWIAGGDSSHYTGNCYFDAGGQPRIVFTARKLRQWPPVTGYGCLAVECRNEAVRAETIRVFSSVPYHGLGYLEVKQDAATGRYLIIEPNVGRPTGGSATAEAAGVELLQTMYCEALGRPLPAQCIQSYRGIKLIHLRRDAQAAAHQWRRGNLTLSQWWQSWRGPKAYAVFAWRDPMPFLADLMRAAWIALSRSERRKRDYSEL